MPLGPVTQVFTTHTQVPVTITLSPTHAVDLHDIQSHSSGTRSLQHPYPVNIAGPLDTNAMNTFLLFGGRICLLVERVRARTVMFHPLTVVTFYRT